MVTFSWNSSAPRERRHVEPASAVVTFTYDPGPIVPIADSMAQHAKMIYDPGIPHVHENPVTHSVSTGGLMPVDADGGQASMAYDLGDRGMAVNPLPQLVNMTFDPVPPAGRRNSPVFDDSERRQIEPAHVLGNCTNMIYDPCHTVARTGRAVSNFRISQETNAMKPHGPWQIVESADVYQDPWIRVRKDSVIRPDGKPGTHSVVNLLPGVCVLAVDDENHVYLTEEFHYGVGRVTLEAVSGGIEPGENPLETASRELREELGIDAEEWIHLGVCDPFTTSVVSPTTLYLARRLRFGTHSQEGTEQIRCVKMSLEEAAQKVLTGEISHGSSSVLILKAVLRNMK